MKSKPKVILETERLRLQEFTLDDCNFIVQLLNSPGWLRNIGDKGVYSHEAATTYLKEGPISGYATFGSDLYMVWCKANALPIGMCGLKKRGGLENHNLGFAFLPDFQGMGYAFEITDALLNHAHKVWMLEKVDAITLPTNQRSIHLLQKLNMQFISNLKLKGQDEVLSLYRRTW
ncbi:GNAT family N-acetyltransferase [Pararhodonellum marinum]|uniref:GNAT family N-acetyltransferase n=1 Tax=Pararhodonellum marinum TaxID=2755358 RepID=UPI00188EF316|nr:GNAT family N-acetyltransferase [Pararhodonellum marinum]